MKDEEKNKILIFGVIIGVIIGMLSCLFSYLPMSNSLRNSGYIEACKDFYEGKLKYELKEFPGGEHKWVKIKTN